MGHENSDGAMVAYIGDQPVEFGKRLPEITSSSQAGDATAEEAATAAERLAAVTAGISVTVEMAAEDLRAYVCRLELVMAVYLARVFKPELACRYLHAKKKRIRKKYEKRIIAWFREAI